MDRSTLVYNNVWVLGPRALGSGSRALPLQLSQATATAPATTLLPSLAGPRNVGREATNPLREARSATERTFGATEHVMEWFWYPF